VPNCQSYTRLKALPSMLKVWWSDGKDEHTCIEISGWNLLCICYILYV